MIMMLLVMCLYQMTGCWSRCGLIMPLCLSQISRIECCVIYEWTCRKTKLSYLKERNKSKRSYCDLLEQSVLLVQAYLRKLSRCSIVDFAHVAMPPGIYPIAVNKYYIIMWYATDSEYSYRYLSLK
jgi:hypothetical protein